MNSALQTLVQSAAGTGGPTNPSSRYLGQAIEMFTRADGLQVAYLQRRLIPQASIYTSVRQYVAVDGDRIDNLAAKFLGDPILAWMICDANGASDPAALTATPGATILIPQTSNLPAGARNG